MIENSADSGNPYEAPRHVNSGGQSRPNNLVGAIGFTLSFVAFFGLCTVGPFGPTISTIGMALTCLSVPGLFVSSAGLFWRPKRWAALGFVLGLVGLCFLPTFYFTTFLAR
jgi:hypothetical protein